MNNAPTSAQVRAARAMLRLTQQECAKRSGIALSALKKYESLENNEFPLVHLRYKTILKLVKLYETEGLTFLFDDNCLSIQIMKTDIA